MGNATQPERSSALDRHPNRSNRLDRPSRVRGGNGNAVLDQPGTALFTSAAPAITLSAGQTSTFTVGGGGSSSQFVSYKASSSNPSVVTASINGKTLTLAGLAGLAGGRPS